MKLKSIIKLVAVVMITGYSVLFLINCGGSKVETKPPVTPVPEITPKEPTIEDLRKPVSKDPAMYKADEVIRSYGRLKKKAINFEKYLQLTGNQTGAPIDPDWFYDTYTLEMNENGYYATVTLGTAKRAKEKDARIAPVMENLPERSITVSLLTPSKKRYTLLDAEADGILDFVKEANDQSGKKMDVALLDSMQEKYTWLMGIIKKNYKKK
ncbi:MAG: hypothetical protein ACM3SY_22575 [Candidatus Omnitrophota bacterium]